ncbi:MAG: hypothetical protein LBT37_06335 [Lactobacillaceae bacterium]|jgi:hypothetical protein|nr:hypothetical protein [Lactobacillaceae bacterium]
MTLAMAIALNDDEYIQSLDLKRHPDVARVIGQMFQELYTEIDADKRTSRRQA